MKAIVFLAVFSLYTLSQSAPVGKSSFLKFNCGCASEAKEITLISTLEENKVQKVGKFLEFLKTRILLKF